MHPSILLLIASVSCIRAQNDHHQDRFDILKREEQMVLGANINLTSNEELVDRLLLKYKHEELEEGVREPGKFSAARHFFDSLPVLEKSKVFHIIKKLPKGASLHSHDTALLSMKRVLELTYKDDLFFCNSGELPKFKFFKNGTHDSSCRWQSVKELRKNNGDFDNYIKSLLSLYDKDHREKYQDINVVWRIFQNAFMIIEGLVTYKPVFQEYYYKALKELYEDNVMYMEFRGYLPNLYDLEGNIYGPQETVKIYRDVLEDFKNNHTGFLGARFIFAPHKETDSETILNYIKIASELKTEYPDFIAGFDMVGQEDLGATLLEHVEHLSKAPNHLNFFFHAGETNWYGSSDLNIVDAVLLGTKRIGHGFALSKHPLIMQEVKNRHIGVEVCPISNQVLKLVDDYRNHPGTIFIANGLSVVICNDDPSFWEAKALSYDWYVAFMGMTSWNSGLRVLKQFAKNSYLTSSMPQNELDSALAQWEDSWSKFIDDLIQENNLIN